MTVDENATERVSVVLPDISAGTAAKVTALFARIGDPKFDVTTFSEPPESVDEWVHRTKNADAIMLGWNLPDEVLLNSDSLRIISFLGTGYQDQINVSLARKQGISIRNVAGYGNNAVAEHAVALIFSVLNRVPEIDKAVREGNWPQPIRSELAGKTLGIVGFGGIGKRLAKLATGLGLEVVVWSRSLKPGTDNAGYLAVELADLFKAADIVSINLALNADTDQIVDERLLRSMKEDAILINTARGALVDTQALSDVLNEGKIRGAGIDVFDSEPIGAEHPLLSAKNAVLTSHVAYNSVEATENMLEIGVQNVLDSF